MTQKELICHKPTNLQCIINLYFDIIGSPAIILCFHFSLSSKYQCRVQFEISEVFSKMELNKFKGLNLFFSYQIRPIQRDYHTKVCILIVCKVAKITKSYNIEQILKVKENFFLIYNNLEAPLNGH